MTKMYSVAAWLMSSVGVAMLMLSLMMVPQTAVADGPGGMTKSPNPETCNENCNGTAAPCARKGCNKIAGCDTYGCTFSEGAGTCYCFA